MGNEKNTQKEIIPNTKTSYIDTSADNNDEGLDAFLSASEMTEGKVKKTSKQKRGYGEYLKEKKLGEIVYIFEKEFDYDKHNNKYIFTIKGKPTKKRKVKQSLKAISKDITANKVILTNISDNYKYSLIHKTEFNPPEIHIISEIDDASLEGFQEIYQEFISSIKDTFSKHPTEVVKVGVKDYGKTTLMGMFLKPMKLISLVSFGVGLGVLASKYIYDEVKDYVPAIDLSGVKNVFNDIASHFSGMKDDLKNALGNVAQYIHSKADKILENNTYIDKWISDTGALISTEVAEIDGLVDQSNAIITQIGYKIANAQGYIQEGIKKNVNKAINSAKKIYDPENNTGYLVDLKNSLETASTHITTAYNTLTDETNGAIAKINGVIDKINQTKTKIDSEIARLDAGYTYTTSAGTTRDITTDGNGNGDPDIKYDENGNPLYEVSTDGGRTWVYMSKDEISNPGDVTWASNGQANHWVYEYDPDSANDDLTNVHNAMDQVAHSRQALSETDTNLTKMRKTLNGVNDDLSNAADELLAANVSINGDGSETNKGAMEYADDIQTEITNMIGTNGSLIQANAAADAASQELADVYDPSDSSKQTLLKSLSDKQNQIKSSIDSFNNQMMGANGKLKELGGYNNKIKQYANDLKAYDPTSEVMNYKGENQTLTISQRLDEISKEISAENSALENIDAIEQTGNKPSYLKKIGGGIAGVGAGIYSLLTIYSRNKKDLVERSKIKSHVKKRFGEGDYQGPTAIVVVG